MTDQQVAENFIGRENELAIFKSWLANPHAPWILYFYDTFEEQDKKGGIGKTWLLRKCATLAKQARQDIATVAIDFFNIEDRGGVAVAERVAQELQAVYSHWSAATFTETLHEYREAINAGHTDVTEIRNKLATALTNDLHQLDKQLAGKDKSLLIFFDTFELVEQNPTISVLRFSRKFPDNYHFQNIGIVIAGRNALDWTHPNWQGREQEIQTAMIAPFSLEEMVEYINANSNETLQVPSKQASALHERTEGRPILVGLAADVLKYRIKSLDQLAATPKADFESDLVIQVNNLEKPINWIILFMAHTYHRFNATLLNYILQKSTLFSEIQDTQQQELVDALPTLSFVRQAGSGNDFVLHDEMRRLIIKYWWEVQDISKRIRQDLSRWTLDYYENELRHTSNEQLRQVYTVDMLYHKLFLDVNDGHHYFEQNFSRAIRLWQTAFARSLLQEAQLFTHQMTLEQRYRLKFDEAMLLRKKEDTAAALKLYHSLETETESDWLDNHRANILFEKGQCYLDQSDFTQAMACFTTCLDLDKQQSKESRNAGLLYLVGYIHRRQGQLDTAIRYFEESSVMYKQQGNQREYANILNSIGNVYRLQGKINEALRICKIGWRIRHDLFQKNEASEIPVGLSLNTMGVIYLNANDIVRAESQFHEAFQIFNRTNYRKGISATYNRFGNIEIAKGALQQAQHWFEAAYQASLGLDMETQINSLNKQGRVLVLLEKWQEALPFFHEAIKLSRQIHDYYQEAESLIDLAHVLERMEQYESSQQALREAEEITTKYNYHYLLGIAEDFQGDIGYNARNYQASFQHYGKYCRHMAGCNLVQYNKALRKIVDLLLNIPNHEILTITNSLIAYWSDNNLEKNYPELIDECQEVRRLVGL